MGSDDILMEALESKRLGDVDTALVERIVQIGSHEDDAEANAKVVAEDPATKEKTKIVEETPTKKEETTTTTSSASTGPLPGEGQPNLTVEQAIQIEREVVERMKTAQPRFALMSVKNSGLNLAMRWQQMAGVMFGVQAQAIPTIGFTADQQGLMTYNGYLGALQDAPENSALRDAVAAKWDFATEIAFGVTEKKPMTREVAGQFCRDMTDRMTTPEFMNRIDKEFAKFGDLSKIPKEDTETHLKIQTALCPLVFEVQLEVSKTHGYDGDGGYVQAQRALMDHTSDPLVSSETQRMWQVLFQRFNK